MRDSRSGSGNFKTAESTRTRPGCADLCLRSDRVFAKVCGVECGKQRRERKEEESKGCDAEWRVRLQGMR